MPCTSLSNEQYCGLAPTCNWYSNVSQCVAMGSAMLRYYNHDHVLAGGAPVCKWIFTGAADCSATPGCAFYNGLCWSCPAPCVLPTTTTTTVATTSTTSWLVFVHDVILTASQPHMRTAWPRWCLLIAMLHIQAVTIWRTSPSASTAPTTTVRANISAMRNNYSLRLGHHHANAAGYVQRKPQRLAVHVPVRVQIRQLRSAALGD